MEDIKQLFRRLFRRRISTRSFMRPAYNGIGGYDIITIETRYSDGSESRRAYIGSGVEWRTFPGFRRCDFLQEMRLYDLWNKHRFGGKINNDNE